MRLVKRASSIGFLLQAVTGMMTVILAVIVALYALYAAAERDRAELTPVLVDVTTDLFTAVQNIRLERSEVNTALVSKDPVSQSALYEIERVRTRSATALDSALAKLRHLHVKSSGRLIDQLEKDKKAFLNIRARADAAYREPIAERPSDLSEHWIDTVGTLVNSIDAVTDPWKAN